MTSAVGNLAALNGLPVGAAAASLVASPSGDGNNAVQVTVNGATLETLPGGHIELDQPLHRSDF